MNGNSKLSKSITRTRASSAEVKSVSSNGNGVNGRIKHSRESGGENKHRHNGLKAYSKSDRDSDNDDEEHNENDMDHDSDINNGNGRKSRSKSSVSNGQKLQRSSSIDSGNVESLSTTDASGIRILSHKFLDDSSELSELDDSEAETERLDLDMLEGEIDQDDDDIEVDIQEEKLENDVTIQPSSPPNGNGDESDDQFDEAKEHATNQRRRRRLSDDLILKAKRRRLSDNLSVESHNRRADDDDEDENDENDEESDEKEKYVEKHDDGQEDPEEEDNKESSSNSKLKPSPSLDLTESSIVDSMDGQLETKTQKVDSEVAEEENKPSIGDKSTPTDETGIRHEGNEINDDEKIKYNETNTKEDEKTEADAEDQKQSSTVIRNGGIKGHKPSRQEELDGKISADGEEEEHEEDADADNIEAGTEAADGEVAEAEADDDAEAEAEADIAAQKRRQEAVALLTDIEIDFAKLRDKLHDDKMSRYIAEIEMCADGSHPELEHVYSQIAHIRDEKIRLAQNRRNYQRQCIFRVSTAMRTQAHQQFLKDQADSRVKFLLQTTEEWYKVNRERRAMDLLVPDYSFRVPERRGAQIRERILMNEEISILEGISKYIGFPAAPEMRSIGEDELQEDLDALGIPR